MAKEKIHIRLDHGSIQDPKNDSCLIEILTEVLKEKQIINDQDLNEKINTCLLQIDRILIRNYLDTDLKEIFLALFKESNHFIKEEIKDNHFFVMDLASEHDLLWPESFVKNFFELTPPFVKPGTIIPENVGKLYSESRYCFVYCQYRAAVALSRTIIEVALKTKIGSSMDNKKMTAGELLEKAKNFKLIDEMTYRFGKRVKDEADNILHQAQEVDREESLNMLEYTKDYLEALFS